MERLTGEVRSLQQSASVAMLMGAKVDWPDLEERLSEFRTWLDSTPEPVAVDAPEAELRAALGLRGPHV